MRKLSALLLVLPLLFMLMPPRQVSAQAQSANGAVQMIQPLPHATVRENVSIKLLDFPPGGYVSVSIDGQFRAASALPKSVRQAVYVWDTKAPYSTPDDPNTPKYYADGTHSLSLSLYDAQSKPLGTASVTVQLANQINLPASQGIKLTYSWRVGQKLRYQRRTLLAALPQDAAPSVQGQPVQQSLIRYLHSIENASGNIYTMRDEVLLTEHPFISYVVNKGRPQAIGAVYAIRSKYRLVDPIGRVLGDLASLGEGDHYSFSIPLLPSHRVSVGAHWSSPIHMSLDWASENQTVLMATSTLEGFEWQDHQPTAKIRETYVGPAIFRPQPNSQLPLVTSQSIHFERTVFFAYNIGRVVHMQTKMEVPVTTSSAQFSTAPSPGQSSGGPGNFGGGPNEDSSNAMPGEAPMMPPPGMPYNPNMQPGMPPPPGGMPGMPGNPNMSPGMPGSMYPGSPQSPISASASQNEPVKLVYTETTVLL